MAMLTAFGGPKPFLTRSAVLAATGMATTVVMVWLARAYGMWYGDGRVLGPGEGFWSFAYAWGTVGLLLYGAWAFNFKGLVRPVGLALVGYFFMGLLAMLGMRFNFLGFLIYWAGAGAATAYYEPGLRGTTRPARMPDRLKAEVQARGTWVRMVMNRVRGGMPPSLQDFVARQLMATVMRPIWKECTLSAPGDAALADLGELALLAKELVSGRLDSDRDQAVYRAVFKALLADWTSIHQG
jgi:hypothetical protein